jgi:hypothetical protein
MATKHEVEQYLKGFLLKMSIFQIVFEDERGKNMQTMIDLELSYTKRKEIISKLSLEDYSEGPIEDQMRGIQPLWVFGKTVKGKELYIKISMGYKNSSTICISFHIAEYPMTYPFKKHKI